MSNIDPKDLLISPVKREKAKKKAKLERKIQMRADMPVLDRYQIRRHRLPLHRALVEELEENGYLSSASFLQQLIDFHEALRNEHGPDTPVWCRPRLIEQKEVLIELAETFKIAEAAHFDNNVAKEFDKMFNIAVKYALGSQNWWWLGEQLLYQCVTIGTNYEGDGKYREALSRYVQGKFLLENMKDPYATTQIEYLGRCRKLSKGMKWSARTILKYKQDTLFVESSKLLLRALLLKAKETREYDPEKAVKLCKIARKRAVDACDRLSEAEVLKLQGLCEMDCGWAQLACESFYRCLILYIKANIVEEICEGRILLALAYLKVQNFTDALLQLETLLKFAIENDMLYYQGQVCRYIGEIYINKGQPELATPIIAEAVKIFDYLNDHLNRRRAKNLSAIAGGQEHIASYIQLIINCGRPGLEGFGYLLKLLAWKDSREPFWGEEPDKDIELEYPEVPYGQIEKTSSLISHLTGVPKEERPSILQLADISDKEEEQKEEGKEEEKAEEVESELDEFEIDFGEYEFEGEGEYEIDEELTRKMRRRSSRRSKSSRKSGTRFGVTEEIERIEEEEQEIDDYSGFNDGNKNDEIVQAEHEEEQPQEEGKEDEHVNGYEKEDVTGMKDIIGEIEPVVEKEENFQHDD